MSEAQAAPALPPCSVDFNALHNAIVRGETAEAAAASAIISETLFDPNAPSLAAPLVDAPSAPATDDVTANADPEAKPSAKRATKADPA